MLALCWLIFRSWASFFRSWSYLMFFLNPLPCLACFLNVRGRSGLDLGEFWEGPGKVLEAPKHDFSTFLDAYQWVKQKMPNGRFVL